MASLALSLCTRVTHPTPRPTRSRPTSPPPHSPSGPEDSPAGRFLRDPLGSLARCWQLTEQFLLDHLLLAAGIAATLGLLIIAGLTARRILLHRRHQHLTQGAHLVEIHAPPQVDPAAAATFWANLLGVLRPRWRRRLLGQPHMAFEYRWDGAELHIQIWVPGPIPAALVARAAEAAWPAARTTITPAPLGKSAAAGTVNVVSPIPADAQATGGVLRLARPDHHPLNVQHAADPIRALLGATAALTHGQHALVQILIRPATGRRLSRAHRAAASLRGTARTGLVGRVLDLLTPGSTPGAARGSSGVGAVAAAHPERAGEIRAILDKATAPRLEVVIRYAVATTHTTDPHATRAWLRGRAHAIGSAFAVFAGRNYLDRHRLRHPAQVLAERRMRRGDLLSVAELAAIAHLPHDPAVPGLARAGANTVPPPPAVPSGGLGTKLLGDSDAGAPRPVALRVADARHHLHLIGATGSGKSTLIAQLVLGDAAAGRAAVVIDPRGDLTSDILDRLPTACADRVWLIDPDTPPPPSLGVLSGPDAHLTSDNLVGIVHRVFADSWGPRTDDILRSAILTLQPTPGATLADIPQLLTDEPYRTRALRHLHRGDEILAGFWSWYTALTPEARANAIGPVMNKLRHFLLRPFVRQVVGTAGAGLDLGGLLDSGGILLVRIPKGTLGDDTARLLGSFVLAKIWETITARARHSETTRRDAALYIDEAHSFLNLPHGIEEMLAEARAYRLSVLLAHQNLTQFPPAMRDAVAANARTKIIFATSPQDAHDLARTTWPTLTDHDLANLGAYQAAARLLVHTQETPAFTLTTRPLPKPATGRQNAIKTVARSRAQATRTPPPLPDPRRTHNETLDPDTHDELNAPAGSASQPTASFHVPGENPPPTRPPA